MSGPNHASIPMASTLKAAALYVALVFAAGFALGALRVLVVEPALGPVIAVLLELPVLLVISWLVCIRITDWYDIPGTAIDRLVMGVLSFVMLMAVETLFGLAFGRPVSAQLAAYATLAGQLGLAGQIGFALVPFIQKFVRSA